MWLCEQIKPQKNSVSWIATVLSVTPAIIASGNGIHKNVIPVSGLILNKGDRAILVKCSGKTVAIAKL